MTYSMETKPFDYSFTHFDFTYTFRFFIGLVQIEGSDWFKSSRARSLKTENGHKKRGLPAEQNH